MLSVIMLNVAMMSVTNKPLILSFVMLNVAKLSVVMLSVMAPKYLLIMLGVYH
jgi:hypothetical protein